MRFQKFMESYDKLVNVGASAATLFKNPDSEEMRECMGDDSAIRGMLLADTGDVYVWTLTSGSGGYQGIVDHSEMIHEMKWKKRPFVPLVFSSSHGRKEVMMSSYYFENSPLYGKMNRSQLLKLISENPNISGIGYEYTKPPAELVSA